MPAHKPMAIKAVLIPQVLLPPVPRFHFDGPGCRQFGSGFGQGCGPHAQDQEAGQTDGGGCWSGIEIGSSDDHQTAQTTGQKRSWPQQEAAQVS